MNIYINTQSETRTYVTSSTIIRKKRMSPSLNELMMKPNRRSDLRVKWQVREEKERHIQDI